MTVIAFVGSVFSPFYFAARRQGPTDPMEHCAINVAVTDRLGGAWVFTEVPRAAVSREADRFQVGTSSIGWEGDRLVVRVDARTAPWGGRVRGTIELEPEALHRAPVQLAARHGWWAVAPRSRVRVALDQPGLRFEGSGYHDANWGDEPVERGFHSWSWSRATLSGGTAVLYDVLQRAEGGGEGSWAPLGRLFRPDGEVEELEAPQAARLWPTPLFWMPRRTRVDAGGRARVLRTLEDAPFYARSWVETTLRGETVAAVHESLDCDRFASAPVQFMLPYRTRRERA